MGIFDNVASSIETKTTSIADYTWAELFPQANAKSGVSVNVDSALRVTTVFACARVLAEGVAQLPICIYDENEDDGTRTEVKGGVLNVLAKRPNDWMTSFEVREQMTIHAVLTGNAYAYLGFGGNPSTLQEIIPLVPGNVQVERRTDWELIYHVSDLAGRTVIVPNENILHLRGPSWNGYLGMAAIQLAREAIGLAITTEETHASLHANGSQPGGILSVKGKLDAPAKERLKAAWQKFQGGVQNKFKTAVLDVDATWTPLQMKGVDAQHLETRRFQIEEICRAMRVFPQMVMHTDKTSTFASAEAFFLSHVTHSLMPWVKRWQEALDHALFANQPNMCVHLSVNEILRGSAADRANFYMAALGGARGETAYMTRNEVRKAEGLNPIAGGDKLLIPVPAPDPMAGGAAPTPATKANPNHDERGRFSSSGGGTGTPRSELIRAGMSIGLSALSGAIKGGASGAALGAAVAIFVESGAASYVGETAISVLGPHILPDWAHDMLVAHHEHFDSKKSVYMDSFLESLSEADMKRMCLEILDGLNEAQIKQLADRLVADAPAKITA